MELKNLDKTQFNWFNTKEIKNLDEVGEKLPFITRFSFGPFAPYYLYHIFHNCWDFLVLEFGASFVAGILAYLTILINFLITGLGSSSVSPYDFKNHSDLYSGDTSFITKYPYALIGLGILIIIVSFGIKIYQGFYCRRLSWNRCEWKDIDSYEQGEKNWNIAGLVFFILQTLFFLVVVGTLVFLYLDLAGAHY